MQFSISAATLLAFAGAALAQNPEFNPVYKPESGEGLTSGQSYTIEWSSPEKFKDVLIDIELIGGPTQNTQVPITTVATGVKNSDEKFTWEIPADIGGENFYGLKLTSESNAEDFQFSNPFEIAKADGAAEDDKPAYGDDEPVTTVNTDYGTATVTLSEVETSTAPCNTTTSAIQVEVPVPTYLPPQNTTLITSSAPVVLPSAPPAPEEPVPEVPAVPSEIEEAPPAESEPVEVPAEAGASAAKAGLLAVVGGVVAAFML